MTIEENDTFRSLLKSNSKMVSTINNDQTYIDDNIKIEMSILYLKLNIELLKTITDDQLLIDSIENDEYYINGNNICNGAKYYSLSFLTELIKRINLMDNEQKHENVIEVDFIKINSSKPKRIIYRTEEEEENVIEKLPGLSKGEKRYILERTQKITEETIDYVDDVKRDFKGNLSYMIYNLLIEDKIVASFEATQFLYAIINLYPLLNYNKDDFEYSELYVPQNEMSLAKATYCSDIIKFKEKIIDSYEHKKEILYLRKEYLSRWRYGTSDKIKAIDDEIRKIDQKEFVTGIDLYEVKTSKYNFNEQIFFILRKALNSHLIDLSICVSDPTITIMNIENDEVDNLLQMHLTTLIKMIDNDKILKILDEHKKLKKEV